MARIVINGNHVLMRHWGRWYKLQGRQAHRIKFNRGQTVMRNKAGTTVFNPIGESNE